MLCEARGAGSGHEARQSGAEEAAQGAAALRPLPASQWWLAGMAAACAAIGRFWFEPAFRAGLPQALDM
eukprot:COSAG01_NODE_3224_length_6388_cov_10.896009_14_plen_69_part_00